VWDIIVRDKRDEPILHDSGLTEGEAVASHILLQASSSASFLFTRNKMQAILYSMNCQAYP
jgi:hypothetical protein